MANLKDLIVCGPIRAISGVIGDLTGTASRATADADGNTISSTYMKSNVGVKHTASTAVGNTITPVYVASDGTATALSFTIAKSVPADANFSNTTYSAGTGMSLSGTTFNHSNSVTGATQGTSAATSGSTLAVPYLTYDNQGHITGGGTHTHTVTGFLTSHQDISGKQDKTTAVTHTQTTAVGNTITPVYVASDGKATAISYTIAKSVPADANFSNTTYSAGTDLSLSGTTFNHKASGVTAGTAGTSSATSGSTLSVPYVTYNAQGHVTAAGVHTHTVTGFLTSHQSLANYYTKSEVDSKVSSVYKPAGSVAFASLPTLAVGVLGNVYNVTDAFTTTDKFIEGAGKSYPAGTNVVVVDAGSSTYKFDVLAGFVDLSSYQKSETAVTHTKTTAVGNATTPVYIASDGKATAISYTIAKSVPSDANFSNTTYSAGTGMSLSGTTFNHASSITAGTVGTSTASSGSTLTVPYVTYNATGHITATGTRTHTVTGFLTSHQDISGKQDKTTAVTHTQTTAVGNTITPVYVASDGKATALSYTIAKSVPADANFSNTTYSAGTDLSLSGTTFNHKASGVTAGTAGTSAATSGSTLSVPYVTYNAQGHVTAAGVHTHTVTGFATSDTKNTAGSTDTSSKIFLVGATSQAANPQTYSHDTVFVDTDGALNSTTVTKGNSSTKVATTAFVATAIGDYVKKAGDTMTGALNFANNIWNKMGDDAYIGDHNIGGHICIKPGNSTYDNSGGIQFYNSSDTALVQLNASSGTLTSSGALGLSNNAAKMQYNSTTEAIEFVFA